VVGTRIRSSQHDMQGLATMDCSRTN